MGLRRWADPNAAQNPSHQYTVADTYTVSLTVTRPAGTAAESKSDYVTVEPGPLDHVTISPAKAFLLFGGTQQFSASAYDQYNNLLPDMPFNRSTVNGGGSIDVGGMFSAGQTEGTYLDTVKAQTTQDENTRQATATVVIGPVLTVNATLQGGPRPAAGLDVPLTISFYNQATELNSTNITTATPEYVFTRADGEVIITDNDTENKIITLKAGGLPVGTFNITLFTPVRSLISGMARR